jgi:hypothetical protein
VEVQDLMPARQHRAGTPSHLDEGRHAEGVPPFGSNGAIMRGDAVEVRQHGRDGVTGVVGFRSFHVVGATLIHPREAGGNTGALGAMRGAAGSRLQPRFIRVGVAGVLTPVVRAMSPWL